METFRRRIQGGGDVWREEVALYTGTGAWYKRCCSSRRCGQASCGVSCIVIVMDMRTTTLDFINLWLCRLALRLISGMSHGCSSG